jgi:DNA polymerase V
LVPEQEAKSVTPEVEQLDLFTDYEALDRQRQAEEAELDQELKLQKALISIRDKFGKNAIVKGLNMKEGATTIERNGQIGGHKA